MNAEVLRTYCLQKKAVTESFPFDKTTLVFKVANKMFALTGLDELEFKVNLKCNPERSLDLREAYACIKPGYHMNKQLWNTVAPQGCISPELFFELVDHSYDLIVESLPKKVKIEFKFISA
ncbi:MAG: MmcQ/YjbR family DNA-binding protein [Flavobacteriales bacterium]|jgi:predicted DNA-binding protein (MmcQ/YjbR family)|nr:MmcQ/YjbR family DNA-binding protein [Flavobacteriales bacterium]